MSELSILQLCLITLTFIWSGFVRSGLGFGGAALSLPFLLLIHNEPLVFAALKIIGKRFYYSSFACNHNVAELFLEGVMDSVVVCGRNAFLLFRSVFELLQNKENKENEDE